MNPDLIHLFHTTKHMASGSLSLKHKALQLQLGQMGFKVAAIIYALGSADSFEEALEVLTRGEQGWQHPFLRNIYTALEYPHERICYICGGLFEDHKGKTRSFPNPQGKSARLSIARATLSHIPQSTCQICYQEAQKPWKLPNCQDHFFCEDCVQTYLAEEMPKGEQVQCPGYGCSCIFSQEMICELVGSKATDQYISVCNRKEIASNPLIHLCPTVDCQGYIQKSTDPKEVLCPICRVSLCSFCGLKWHFALTCSQALDEELKIWSAGMAIKSCPNCQRLIEKNHGCDHMTCLACKHQWCWLCLEVCGPNHFKPGSPDACTQYSPLNLQSEKRKRGGKCRTCCLYLSLILAFPFMLMILPLCFPCLLFMCLSKELKKTTERLMAFLVCCCCFVFLCPILDTAIVLWLYAMVLKALRHR